MANDLSDLTSRVPFENDVALVALGEASYGAGLGARVLAYITVSTGVNGARIVEGQIDPANVGLSMGRQYVSMDEPPVTWENLISGKATTLKYGVAPRELGKEHPLWEELARVTAFGVNNCIVHWMPERVVLGGSMFNEIGISVERVRAHLADIFMTRSDMPEIIHSKLGDVGGLWGGLALLKQKQI